MSAKNPLQEAALTSVFSVNVSPWLNWSQVTSMGAANLPKRRFFASPQGPWPQK
jgi:hypothetical protein